ASVPGMFSELGLSLPSRPSPSSASRTIGTARAVRVRRGRRTSVADAAAFDEGAGEEGPVLEAHFHLCLQVPGFAAGVDIAVLVPLEGPFAIDGDIARDRLPRPTGDFRDFRFGPVAVDAV